MVMLSLVWLMISIHSPRMGRDLTSRKFWAAIVISIHSPRMGRDTNITNLINQLHNFNPLSPHGERLIGWKRDCR